MKDQKKVCADPEVARKLTRYSMQTSHSLLLLMDVTSLLISSIKSTYWGCIPAMAAVFHCPPAPAAPEPSKPSAVALRGRATALLRWRKKRVVRSRVAMIDAVCESSAFVVFVAFEASAPTNACIQPAAKARPLPLSAAHNTLQSAPPKVKRGVQGLHLHSRCSIFSADNGGLHPLELHLRAMMEAAPCSSYSALLIQ